MSDEQYALNKKCSESTLQTKSKGMNSVTEKAENAKLQLNTKSQLLTSIKNDLFDTDTNVDGKTPLKLAKGKISLQKSVL